MTATLAPLPSLVLSLGVSQKGHRLPPTGDARSVSMSYCPGDSPAHAHTAGTYTCVRGIQWLEERTEGEKEREGAGGEGESFMEFRQQDEYPHTYIHCPLPRPPHPT